MALTLAAGAWLFAVLVISTSRLLLARREHRRRLDLLADELQLGQLIPVPGPAPGGPVTASAASPAGLVAGLPPARGRARREGRRPPATAPRS